MKQMNGTQSVGPIGRELSLKDLTLFLSKMSKSDPRTVPTEDALPLEYSLVNRLVKLIHRDVTTRYLRGDKEFHGGEIIKIVDLFKLTPAGEEFLVSYKEEKRSPSTMKTEG